MGQLGWGAALQALGQDLGRMPERLQQAREAREWPKELERRRALEDIQRRQVEQTLAQNAAREARDAEMDALTLQQAKDLAGKAAVQQVPFDVALPESAPAVQRAQETPASAVLEAIGGKMPGTETAFEGMTSDPSFLGASTSASMGGLTGEGQFRRLPLMDEKLLLAQQKVLAGTEFNQGRLGVMQRNATTGQMNAETNAANAESLAALRRSQQALNGQKATLAAQQRIALQNGDAATVIRLQQQSDRLDLDLYRIQAQLDTQFKTPFGGRVEGAPAQPTAPVINNYMIPPPASLGSPAPAGAPAGGAAPAGALPLPSTTNPQFTAFVREVESGFYDAPDQMERAKQRLGLSEGKTPAELLRNAQLLKILKLRELRLQVGEPQRGGR